MTLPTGTPLLEVLLSPEAEQDLLEIYTYTAANVGQEQADTILGKLEQAILSLENLPLRGNVPPELEIVGITRYREIHVHPWRIIYEALDTMVHVHWIFDSRRDVAGQLAHKVLRG